MKLLTNAPNFSILLPGPCNAACEFCFLKKARSSPRAGFLNEYLSRLDELLRSLPKQFYQISLTGGEPTLSPYLTPVLSVLSAHRERYTNIVLTTNGAKLETAYPSFLGIVDHANISVHHYDEDKNQKVFGGSYRTTTHAIEHCVDRLGSIGIDACANCVIDDGVSLKFIAKYVRFAQSVGFRAVHFRKRNGTNDPVPAEAELSKDYPVKRSSSCPVCRERVYIVHGMEVCFKTAVLEPDDVSDGAVYEVVFLPDGWAYSDWGGKHRVLPGEESAPRKTAVRASKDDWDRRALRGCSSGC